LFAEIERNTTHFQNELEETLQLLGDDKKEETRKLASSSHSGTRSGIIL